MSDPRYIKGEFDSLISSTEFKIKVHGDHGETKWINASRDVVTVLRVAMTGELAAAVDAATDALNAWGGAPAEEFAMASAGDFLANAVNELLALLGKAGN